MMTGFIRLIRSVRKVHIRLNETVTLIVQEIEP
jgi:hypothetical protein